MHRSEAAKKLGARVVFACTITINRPANVGVQEFVGAEFVVYRTKVSLLVLYYEYFVGYIILICIVGKINA